MVTPETARLLLRELYGYEVDERDARIVANGVGALHAGARALLALNLTGLEAPVSYASLLAEAERLNQPQK